MSAGWLDRPVCRHLVTIIGGTLILGVLYDIPFKQIQLQTYRRVVSAIITDKDYEYAEDDNGHGGPYWSIGYEFHVGEKTYSGSDSAPYDSPLRVGDRITISYAGNHPEISSMGVVDTGPRLFLNWIIFLAGILGFFYYIKSYLKRGPMWWMVPAIKKGE